MEKSKYVWKEWKKVIEKDVSKSISTSSISSHIKSFKSNEELKPFFVPKLWKGWELFIGKRSR